MLLAAGHDPGHLLDRYSFGQLALFARCTLGHHVRMLNMLLRPVLAAQGVGWEDAEVPAAQSSAPRTPEQEDAREAALLQKLAASPIPVRVLKTSSGPDTSTTGEAG